MDRAVDAEFGEVRQSAPKEVREFSLGHLPGRHRELAMPGLSEPRDITCYPHIVWRIGENDLGAFATKKAFVASSLEGISAKEKMVPDLPAIAKP